MESATRVVTSHNLNINEVSRYSRQLILPEIGPNGQEKLRNSRVLVVGAGGLGCPVALYLAAAGIGTLGIVDYDSVELGNLQRQVLHREAKIGENKASSASESLEALNSGVICIPHACVLSSANAISLLIDYDIIVDCSDNVPTRYLLSDACVLLNKPLVSGSALRFEGQLTVYHFANGPCYRCLFPSPPPRTAVSNCSDVGVFGAVTGVIGSLQALEAAKIIVGLGSAFSGKMLLFDGMEGSFRTVRLRGRRSDCVACGENPTLTELIDYEGFCAMKACDKVETIAIVPECDRVSVTEYAQARMRNRDHILLDVRPSIEFSIAHLPGAINLPFAATSSEPFLEADLSLLQKNGTITTKECFVVCHRGNDSQFAILDLRKKFPEYVFKDIVGGLGAWSLEIDSNFPQY